MQAKFPGIDVGSFCLEDGRADLSGKSMIPLWERTYGRHVLMYGKALQSSGRSPRALEVGLVQGRKATLRKVGDEDAEGSERVEQRGEGSSFVARASVSNHGFNTIATHFISSEQLEPTKSSSHVVTKGPLEVREEVAN